MRLLGRQSLCKFHWWGIRLLGLHALTTGSQSRATDTHVDLRGALLVKLDEVLTVHVLRKSLKGLLKVALCLVGRTYLLKATETFNELQFGHVKDLLLYLGILQ